ncbi:MAG TPA: PAS domain-containing protein [Acidobacteriota bacterium]|nr:PAS domain-containing protein [Acidobacteriota bacterium]
MAGEFDWIEGLPAAVTVADAEGTIVAMNARSRETFAEDGGAALLGKCVFDCHPEPARAKLRALYAKGEANHYTIEKAGRRKIIHQLPWFKDGRFAGFVEISVPLPAAPLPHFDRG